MKPISWQRTVEVSECADGTTNVIYWFVSVWVAQKHRWSFRLIRWRHDGLTRRTLYIGPLTVNWGRDHYWLDEGESA